MAIRTMGHGYCQEAFSRIGGIQVPNHGNKLLHQMDRIEPLIKIEEVDVIRFDWRNRVRVPLCYNN